MYVLLFRYKIYHTSRSESSISGEMETATLATYSAGGFVANLGRDHNSSVASVARLLAAQWIDKRTRAVYLELLAYNPATSLYTIGRLSFEFFAGGGLLTGHKFESLQFDWFSKMNIFLVLCLQFCLIALVLVCFLTSLRGFCKQQLSFFKVCTCAVYRNYLLILHYEY